MDKLDRSDWSRISLVVLLGEGGGGGGGEGRGEEKNFIPKILLRFGIKLTLLEAL
jgi:hypothetical protein